MEKGSEIAQKVYDRHNAGEELILAIRHPFLRRFHRNTVLRWISAGRLETMRIGRSFYTVDSLVKEAIVSDRLADESLPPPPRQKPGPKPKRAKVGASAHSEAVADLKRRGMM